MSPVRPRVSSHGAEWTAVLCGRHGERRGCALYAAEGEVQQHTLSESCLRSMWRLVAGLPRAGIAKHEALGSTGANVNLFIPNALIDPISAAPGLHGQ